MNLISKITLSILLFSNVSGEASGQAGLVRHDFFYAGESKQPRMFIVKNGELFWEHLALDRKGEISDAVLLTDGNMLIAHQYGIAEIAPDHTTVWSYDAPSGCEIHTIQPIGEDKVVFVQNGNPAKVVVMEIPSLHILKEFVLPVSEKGSVHGQFRNARLTSRGTLLVSNMGLGFVSEYNSDGKEIDRWDIPGPWSATEVGKSANLLIVGKGSVLKEIDRRGNIISEMHLADYGVTSPQKAVRLKNGKT
ncbi:MAG: hypothetical protein K2H49_00740, partial [Muribaculaceae bacterium]|nr:hypothetical protein [Muribaculaceae bacterium]